MEPLSDSEDEERLDFILNAIDAYKGTFFEYSFDGAYYKMPKVL